MVKENWKSFLDFSNIVFDILYAYDPYFELLHNLIKSNTKIISSFLKFKNTKVVVLFVIIPCYPMGRWGMEQVNNNLLLPSNKILISTNFVLLP